MNTYYFEQQFLLQVPRIKNRTFTLVRTSEQDPAFSFRVDILLFPGDFFGGNRGYLYFVVPVIHFFLFRRPSGMMNKKDKKRSIA
jgi:hypothetical protein